MQKIELMHKTHKLTLKTYNYSSKLNSPVGSNLIRRLSTSLQRKHDNIIHSISSEAFLDPYLLSEKLTMLV